MKKTTYTAAQIEELERLIDLARHAPDTLAWHAQAAQIVELERLIYFARTEPDSLAWRQANLLEWITTWCADQTPVISHALQARALRVFRHPLWRGTRSPLFRNRHAWAVPTI